MKTIKPIFHSTYAHDCDTLKKAIKKPISHPVSNSNNKANLEQLLDMIQRIKVLAPRSIKSTLFLAKVINSHQGRDLGLNTHLYYC